MKRQIKQNLGNNASNRGCTAGDFPSHLLCHSRTAIVILINGNSYKPMKKTRIEINKIAVPFGNLLELL